MRGPDDSDFSEVAELAVPLAATAPPSSSLSSSSVRPSVVARQVALSSVPASSRLPNTSASSSSSSSSRHRSHCDPRSTDVPVRSPRVSFAETQLNKHTNGYNDSAGDSSRYGTISPSSLGLLTPNPYHNNTSTPTYTAPSSSSSSSTDASGQGQGQGQGHVGHAFAAFASFMASLGLPLMPPQHTAQPSSSMTSPRGSGGRHTPSVTMAVTTPQRHRQHHPPSSRLSSDCTPSQEVSDFLRRKSALSSGHHHHRTSASSGGSVVSVSSSGSARRTWRASDPNHPSSAHSNSSHRSDVPSPAASEFLRRKHAQMKAKAALSPPRPPRLLQPGLGPGGVRVDPRVATVRGVSSVTDVAALFPSLATLAPSTHTTISNSNSKKDKDPRQQQQSSSSKTKATRTTTPEEKEEQRLAMAVRLAASNGSTGTAMSPNHQSGGRVYSLLMSPERRQRARQTGVDPHHANDSQDDPRSRPLVPTWMTVGSAAG